MNKSLTFSGASLSDTHTLPASTGTIIKIDLETNTLNFVHVGDSYGIAYYKDGHSRVFTDNKNKIFDDRMFELLIQIAKERNITYREARQDERMKNAFVQMFIERNNNPEGTGSGLINGDPNVEKYIQSEFLPLDGIDAILLGSDGLAPQGWFMQNEVDRQRMLVVIRKEGFRKLFELKHNSEDSDPDWTYIRFKHSDDGTGIVIDLSKT